MNPMVIASCKNRFLGSLVPGKLRWDFPDDLGPADYKRRVCVFVHGFKNTDQQALAAYTEILTRASASYDLGVAFLWPAGATPFFFPWVQSVPFVPTVKALRLCLRMVAEWKPARLDVNAHSLGAGIALEALQFQPKEFQIDHLWLVAGCCSPDLSPYRSTIVAHVREEVDVFYSHLDAALAASWAWLPSGPKLGQIGEIGAERIALSTDFTDEVGTNHTGYRHSSLAFQMYLDAQRLDSRVDI